MNTSIVRKKTPEEREIEKKQSEFIQIQDVLAQKELELTTLNKILSVFECEYLRVVGIRYAELDALEALIAEAQAEQFPDDTSARQRASDYRTRAEQSEREAESGKTVTHQPDFKPDDDIKKLYRELAKLVHPDLAIDEDDRIRRTILMAEVNDAYSCGDTIRLQNLYYGMCQVF